MSAKIRSLFAAAAIAAFIPASGAMGAVVYQSTGDAGGVNINGNAFDYLGDSAFLAGTDRSITQIDVATRTFNVRPFSNALTLELYADNNADGLPDDVDAVTPGNQYQVLGSSSILLTYPAGAGGQNQTASFPFANVLVPDNIVWAIKQDTFDNNFQIVFGSPATIGDSFTSSGAERAVVSSQGNPDFQRVNVGGPEPVVTITAVPEPAAFGVLGLAATAGLSRRRRAAR